MLVPNRHASSNSYRYGFQGQEKDDELKGEGNSLNYTFRMHDPRVGRFFAVDPLTKSYPHYTPYSFSGNKVIAFRELEGLEEIYAADGKFIDKIGSSTEIRILHTNSFHSPETMKEKIKHLNNSRDRGNMLYNFQKDILLQDTYETSIPFVKHHIMKASLGTRIRFGQKYISRPDGKINIQNDDYPIVSFYYEKAFGASNSNYHYDLISGTVDYNKTIGNKGDFGLRFKAGKFFNADNISFVDYKHFNGNQTHVTLLNNSLNSFNLLPYYSHSTNDAYLETHIEHNFKGYIMNKIPLLNKLQWNLIGGFHQLNIPNMKPYQEFTVGFDNIGWGKFRFLRVDYVRSYQNGFQGDGIMFGLKF